jgi:hypothetical protein
MILTKVRAIAGSVVLAGGAAVLAPAAPALAYISPPLVLLGAAQSPSYLVAGGAAVDVVVEYSCSADGMYIGVQLTEKVGKKVASGHGNAYVGCDAATHRTLVRVTPDPAGAAFKKGTAVADTNVSGCIARDWQWYCGNDTVTRTINLK